MPSAWTGNQEVYAACLLIERENLKGGIVDSPCLPVLSTAGEHGSIATLPWALIEKTMQSSQP